MPASWTPEFDFYMGTRGGTPYLFSIDLGAREHIPLDGHTGCMQVRVKMKNPRPDGLRDTAESDALFDLEERVAAHLANAIDAIYWGKIVGAGVTQFLFQVPVLPDAAPPELDPSALDGYLVNVSVATDSAWAAYLELYPNDYQQHQMRNRQVQVELERHGDDLERRRRIDHTAIFATEGDARAATVLLKKRGFRVGRPSRAGDPADGAAVVLEFHRTDSCEGHTPNNVTAEIMDCIELSGGTYDGWGSRVRR